MVISHTFHMHFTWHPPVVLCILPFHFLIKNLNNFALLMLFLTCKIVLAIFHNIFYGFFVRLARPTFRRYAWFNWWFWWHLCWCVECLHLLKDIVNSSVLTHPVTEIFLLQMLVNFLTSLSSILLNLCRVCDTTLCTPAASGLNT